MRSLQKQLACNLPILLVTALLTPFVIKGLFARPISYTSVYTHLYTAASSTFKAPLYAESFAEANYSEVFSFIAAQRTAKNKIKSYFISHYSQDVLASINKQLSNTTISYSVNLLFTYLLYLLNCVLLI